MFQEKGLMESNKRSRRNNRIVRDSDDPRAVGGGGDRDLRAR